MAVTSVGTPVSTHATAGSVTGTWGTGQNRAAGDLLVAVVTVAATTATHPATASGWSLCSYAMNRIDTVSQPPVWSAVFVKLAAGSDAAPVFTSTVTGTGAMDCLLLELAGATTFTGMGTYFSGNASSTVTMSAATPGVTASAGGFAVSCFAQSAAAASLTFSASGSFTKLLNGNGVSSVLQTYVGTLASPAAGAAVTDGGAFSTNTAAYGSGNVVVFGAGPASGREAYLNNAAATVTAGGTTAAGGVSGTTETWTVSVTSAFPVAKAGVGGGAFPLSVAGVIGFHAVDPVLPAEKFLVTAAPGGTGTLTWAVTRGADGTAPVAHAAGFAVVPVVSAWTLGNIPPMRTVTSPRYGAMGDGSTNDTAAIQNALNDAAAEGGGKVYIPAGTFNVSNLTIDSYVTLEGGGRGTVLSAVAGTTGYMLSLTSPALSQQTVISSLTLWPNQAGCGGIQLDNTGYGQSTVTSTGDPCHTVRDVYVWQAGGDAFHFDNNQRSLRLSNCVQYSCTGNGFYFGHGLLSGGAGCTDSEFTNCLSGSSGGHGFWLDGGWNSMFSTCKAFFAGWNGSAFNTTSCAFEIDAACSDTTLVGCSAQNGALHGFDLNGCTYVSLTGCETDSNASGATATGAGININGAANCSVVANTGNTTAGNNQLYGIQVSGTNTNTLIVGNSVYGINGPFNYVSGGGYTLISPATTDLSGISQVKLPSGTVIPGSALGTVTAGAVENDGTSFYATSAASSRQVIDAEQFTALASAYTLASSTSAQQLFNATTSGALTVPAATSYFFECEFDLTALSATSGTFSFGFGGTATIASCKYYAKAQKAYAAGAVSAAGTAWQEMTVTTSAATVLVTASTVTTGAAYLRGIIRTTAAGTLIPQVTLSQLATPVVSAGSWFRAWPVGTSTVASVGNWS